MIRHSLLRNEIYYFNIRLKNNIFYRKSLKTDSPSVARALIKQIQGFIEKKVNVLKSELDEFIEMLIGNKVSKALYATHGATKPHSDRGKTSRIQAIASAEMNSTPEFQANVEQLEFVKSRLKAIQATSPTSEVFRDNSGSPFRDNFAYSTPEKKNFDILHKQLNEYIQSAINSNTVDELKREITALKEHFKDYLSDKQKKEHGVIQEKPLLKASQEPEIDSPYFKDLWEEYSEWLEASHSTKDMFSDRRSSYSVFLPALKSKRLHEIDADYIRGVWNTLLYFPSAETQTAKKYGIVCPQKEDRGGLTSRQWILNKTWEEFQSGDLSADDIAEEDLYSHVIIKKWFKFIKDFFAFADEKGYVRYLKAVDTLSTAPAKDRKSVRVGLPNIILHRLLGHAIENRNLNKKDWIMLIMAYSAMRPSEVCNLQPKHIVKDEDTEIYYFNITKGKTANATRKVPIHSKLLKLGFLDLVSENKKTIFDFKASHMSAHFDKLRSILDIPFSNTAGELLNLYSLRHNVISLFGSHSEEDKYRLFGHHSNRTSKGYTHKQMKDAQSLIEEIKH